MDRRRRRRPACRGRRPHVAARSRWTQPLGRVQSASWRPRRARESGKSELSRRPGRPSDNGRSRARPPEGHALRALIERLQSWLSRAGWAVHERSTRQTDNTYAGNYLLGLESTQAPRGVKVEVDVRIHHGFDDWSFDEQLLGVTVRYPPRPGCAAPVPEAYVTGQEAQAGSYRQLSRILTWFHDPLSGAVGGAAAARRLDAARRVGGRGLGAAVWHRAPLGDLRRTAGHAPRPSRAARRAQDAVDRLRLLSPAERGNAPRAQPPGRRGR